jgi:AcrR family transcriptional regulator
LSARVTASGRVRTKGEQTHAAILQAAEDIFAERGFARTRLEDIAERVGVRRASLVYYYKTKAALYGAVLDRLLGDLLAKYDSVQTSGELSRRLPQLVEEWAAYVEGRPALLRIMLREMADGFTPHARPFAYRAVPLIGSIGSTVAEAHSWNTVTPINPLHFMMIVAGASAFLLLGAPLALQNARGRLGENGESQHRLILRSLSRVLLGAEETDPQPGQEER